MKFTRLSLLYPITVLWISGSLLLFMPRLVFSLLGSNVSYEIAMGNLLGMMFLGLGSLVTLVYRYELKNIYRWTIWIRVFFCLCCLGFYFVHKNPFFLSLFGIILVGAMLTLVGYLKDKPLKQQW